jgi:site-specific DNA recombinase
MSTTRCASYARYSTDKQNPLSTQDQLEKSRQFAREHGWQFLEHHVYTDEEISGATLDRPGLRLLMAAAKSKPRPFDVLLIEDASRLSRKQADVLNLCEELKFAEVKICFISQGIDSADEKFQLLLLARGMIDQLFLADTAKRVRRGLEGLIRRGLHTGGRCFGYRSRKDADGTRLKINESEAAIVRRIFTLYASGHSFKWIAKRLNAEHVTSPQPQKGRLSRSWCPSSIRTILHNERYIGKVVWSRGNKVRDPKTGRRVFRTREGSKPIEGAPAPHLRIISDELWKRVQDRIELVKGVFGDQGRKGGLLRARAASSPYLFSGLLKCGLCGANIVIVSGRGRNHGTAHYGCPMYALRGTCKNSLRVGHVALERELLSKIQGEVLRDEVVTYTLAKFEEELEKALGQIGGEMDQMQQRKQKLESEVSRLAHSIAEGFDSVTVRAEIAKREREMSEIADRLLTSRPDSVRSQIKNIRTFVISRLADIRGLLNSDPVTAKTEIAKHVSKITLQPIGGTYRISGIWDLLGTGNARMECAEGQNRTAYAGLFRAALYR